MVNRWFKSLWSVVSVIVLATMLVAAASNAATVTTANDTPTSLQTSAAANHSLIFTTPSGTSDGETIVISFSSAFDTASIAEDDVDVRDDGVDLTTATNCGGPEQASVAMAADALTVTICPTDGGAIAAGSVVTIVIGTNASASGTGANQITNPPASGTYFLSISGTFGDSGTIALPMLDAGSIGVTGTVVATPISGSGGTTSCGDSTDPVISSVLVSDVTSSTATVSWATDESSDGALDYGLTGSYESGTVTSTSLVTSHSLSLTGLTEGATYHARVRSGDFCSNQGVSSDLTFSTTDESAPVITAVTATVLSSTSVQITWTTDESATSAVSYGTTASYGSSSLDASYLTAHSLTLTGLSEGTTYHFLVSSSDASGNSASSSDATFATTSNPAPANVSDLSVTALNEAASVSWTNPADSDLSGILVLVCESGYPSGPSDAACVVAYDGLGTSASVDGLINGTTYYFGVFAYDTAGQFASGALGSGTPSTSEEEVPTPEEEAVPAVTPTEGVPSETVVPESTETAPASETIAEETAEPSEEVPAGTAIPAEEAPSIPPTTVAVGELVPQGDVSFFVANGQIELEPSGSGTVRVLGDRPLRVALETTRVTKEVSRVQLVLGSEAYIMALSKDGSTYAADVSTPETSADYGIAASIIYADGSVQSIAHALEVVGDGFAYAQDKEEITRIIGATVYLLESGAVSWDGSPFGQYNPITTSGTGGFGWYVPNTTYALSAEAGGYLPSETGTFSVTDHIANASIRLEPVLAPMIPVSETSAPAESVQIVSAALEGASAALEAMRSIPGAKEAAAVSTPAIAVAAVASAVVLATSFDLLAFLQSIFSSPVLFFGRRKRRAFGVVYGSVTKVPLDLATVRLFRMPDDWDGEKGVIGRLVQSRVTDKGGRYFFLPPPGKYRITASKATFVFPSTYLGDVKDDGSFLDVYHGEPILVTDRDASVTANIPLDPVQAADQRTPWQILRRARLRKIQAIGSVAGIVLSVLVAIIRPTVFSAAMVAVQMALYLLVRRLAMARKPKSWGIVYDRETGRPLGHVIARVFEPKYNKLLETAVTDGKGRYSFLLGPNEYYTVYEKEGFASAEIRPIDYRSLTEPSEFSRDVQLSRGTSV